MVVELYKDFQARYNKLIFSKLQYRNSRTGARSTRTQIDHDVFEGLPVRHWRKRSFNVSIAPEKDNLDLLGTGDTGWSELSMPRDAHMYSPMSEALLRAARMGQVKKPATPLMDDEKEPGEDEDADGDLDMGFVAKRWAVLPKDLEGPEPEFLAKRRKGLPSVYTGATGPFGTMPQMRKTKIRKVDVEGNSYIWEVLLPEGQAVDGEIVEEETSPTQVPVPGTVVEGLGVVNAEGVVIAGDQAMPAANRRRPPPPKRKAKGPGRGRKKKAALVSGTEGASTVNGVGAILNGSSAGAEDSKNAQRGLLVPDGDTEMGDENVLQEGEEGSEEVSEGEEGEDGDREEGELSPSPTPVKSPAEPPTIVVNDIKVESAAIIHDATPSPSKLALSSQAEPTHETRSDPMLLDEDDHKTMNHSFPEPTVASIAQNTESTMNVAIPATAAVSEETRLTPESILKPSEAVEELPHGASIVDPQDKSQLESMTTPLPDSMLQSQPEHIALFVEDEITESLTEQSAKSPPESLTKSGTASPPDVPIDHMKESVVGLTAEAVLGERPGASPTIPEQAVPESRADRLEPDLTNSFIASPMGAAPELATNTVSSLLTNTIPEPKEEPKTEILPEPPTKPLTEPVREPDTAEVQLVEEQPLTERSIVEQPVAEQPAIDQPVSEQPTRELPTIEQLVTEQTITEPPMAEQPMTESPMAEQSMTESPVAEQPMTESPVAKQPMTESPIAEQPMTEQPMTEQPRTEQPRTEQPRTEQPRTEQPLTEQSMTEQSMADRWGRQATEPFPEAISPERRFSYTRVTTSPQAPTPSPPTPIENTFGLKAPYLSPKAPTMSPPTPIARSMSSSPDIPLADQHFRLPPQVDAAQEADQVQAPDRLQAAGAHQTPNKTAADTEFGVNAPMVVESDTLAGTAEPKIAVELEGSTQLFPDGEEDLLGSLERSLGKQGGRS